MKFSDSELQREKFDDLLFRIKCDIDFYDSRNFTSDDLSLEELKEFYEIALHVASTLDSYEIHLIWNLRCCRRGSTYSYLKASQLRLDAYNAEKQLGT